MVREVLREAVADAAGRRSAVETRAVIASDGDLTRFVAPAARLAADTGATEMRKAACFGPLAARQRPGAPQPAPRGVGPSSSRRRQRAQIRRLAGTATLQSRRPRQSLTPLARDRARQLRIKSKGALMLKATVIGAHLVHQEDGRVAGRRASRSAVDE